MIDPVGHLRDHPQHDHVVQPVGGAQQVLNGLQLVVGALVEVLTREQIVAGSSLVEVTVPTHRRAVSYHHCYSDHTKPVLEQSALTVSRGQQ